MQQDHQQPNQSPTNEQPMSDVKSVELSSTDVDQSPTPPTGPTGFTVIWAALAVVAIGGLIFWYLRSRADEYFVTITSTPTPIPSRVITGAKASPTSVITGTTASVTVTPAGMPTLTPTAIETLTASPAEKSNIGLSESVVKYFNYSNLGYYEYYDNFMDGTARVIVESENINLSNKSTQDLFPQLSKNGEIPVYILNRKNLTDEDQYTIAEKFGFKSDEFELGKRVGTYSDELKARLIILPNEGLIQYSTNGTWGKGGISTPTLEELQERSKIAMGKIGLDLGDFAWDQALDRHLNFQYSVYKSFLTNNSSARLVDVPLKLDEYQHISGSSHVGPEADSLSIDLEFGLSSVHGFRCDGICFLEKSALASVRVFTLAEAVNQLSTGGGYYECAWLGERLVTNDGIYKTQFHSACPKYARWDSLQKTHGELADVRITSVQSIFVRVPAENLGLTDVDFVAVPMYLFSGTVVPYFSWVEEQNFGSLYQTGRDGPAVMHNAEAKIELLMPALVPFTGGLYAHTPSEPTKPKLVLLSEATDNPDSSFEIEWPNFSTAEGVAQRIHIDKPTKITDIAFLIYPGNEVNKFDYKVWTDKDGKKGDIIAKLGNQTTDYYRNTDWIAGRSFNGEDAGIGQPGYYWIGIEMTSEHENDRERYEWLGHSPNEHPFFGSSDFSIAVGDDGNDQTYAIDRDGKRLTSENPDLLYLLYYAD